VGGGGSRVSIAAALISSPPFDGVLSLRDRYESGQEAARWLTGYERVPAIAAEEKTRDPDCDQVDTATQDEAINLPGRHAEERKESKP